MQYVRGVGPARAKALAQLDVRTVGDLVQHYPFRYEDIPCSIPIGSVEPDEVATLIGELRKVRKRGALRSPTISAAIIDATGTCRVKWFNASYLADKLHNGTTIRLTGKVSEYNDAPMLVNPEWTIIDDNDDPFATDHDQFRPVYPATAGLSSVKVARLIGTALDAVLPQVEDYLPKELRELRKLPPRRTAVERMHRPTAADDIPVARRRLAYDELLLCQLAVQLSRRRLRSGPPAQSMDCTDEMHRRIRKRLPFVLTDGQDQAVAEIGADLATTTPMNRLLQADVGAGKTAVALYAALIAIANRCQVAFLAPTEVLAEQHRDKITAYLTGSKVRTAYLAGSTSKTERAKLLADLSAGRIDLLVGTHAMLEPDVRFAKLALVVIDEQHKFGVAQRAALRQKGQSPHTLVLSATPIPRTLAMTVFGDLDVSTVTTLPSGRQPILTKLVKPRDTAKAWNFVRGKLLAGDQAYIVYPLVDESETLPLKAARVEVERLSKDVLPDSRIALLHGRMKKAEKSAIVNQFRAGKIDALVATTVVEVGVDVPNATMMVIEHPERFGLSQLHQLRGRVGRGTKPSYCLLMAQSKEVSERLAILCETADGFRIAEEDLRLRGPGELVGTRQHGIPLFKVANLLTDLDLLELARQDATAILRADSELQRDVHHALHRALKTTYADMISIADA